MTDVVNKLWGFCHTLRHDGIDYGDYIEQLTYLLFLKMADERNVPLPHSYDWTALREKSGAALMEQFSDTLSTLQKSDGIIGDIFSQPIPRFNNADNLKRVIKLIDEEEWSAMGVDVKGAAFEGLLERAASEGKKGAGQYFTPRPLIQTIVRVMQPDPRAADDFAICDPACGTGGFLIEAFEWYKDITQDSPVDLDVTQRVLSSTYNGQDLVVRPRRLALMNLYLHGVLNPRISLGDTIYDKRREEQYNCILTNPPFGTKGVNQIPDRPDFVVKTSSKQLNFVQHVMSVLKSEGRAAMVLPDNCLFEDKACEVLNILMQNFNLHTILRLPRGTFTPYSQGVKANVIFFQKGLPTSETWIFDARSNVPGITKKERPLTSAHFAEFEVCYGAEPNGHSLRMPAERFRRFTLAEIKERDYKLDITWLKDKSLDDPDNLPEPQDLASEAITELEAVTDALKEIMLLIEANGGNSDE